eukprot:3132237-Prymnesium_polylepis.1
MRDVHNAVQDARSATEAIVDEIKTIVETDDEIEELVCALDCTAAQGAEGAPANTGRSISK